MAVFSKIFSLASAVLYLTLFSNIASCTPLSKEFQEGLKEDLFKRANTFAITGATNGGVQPRISIRNMQNNNPDQFNLYLMAMDNFKWMDQSIMTSYYKIAGIHGVPVANPWDGVVGDSSRVGYCTHSSIQFPFWHRVYLALFEQAFEAMVTQTVNSIKDSNLRNRMANVATTIRLPYFDWAQGPGKAATVLPPSITDKMVTIPDPNGGTRTIINPLFRFDTHPFNSNDMYLSPWNQWPVTLRWPESTNAGASSRENMVTSAIQNNAQYYHDSIYNVLTACSSYNEIASDQAQYTSPGCSNSLEGVHNSIHNDLGGQNMGHMTYLWWAAYDPVFWIHHVNVDRIFAMWQVINSGSNGFFDQGAKPIGADSYTHAKGDSVGPDTPLDPFHSDTRGTSWTSRMAKSISTFGYTYPEIQQANGNAGTMRNIVNQLYGNSGSANRKRDAFPETLPFAGLAGGLPQLPAGLFNQLKPTGRTQQYQANIIAPRWALQGSYSIYTFMSKNHTTDSDMMSADPNMVGKAGIFANPGMMGDLLVSTSVPLTSALVAKMHDGSLNSLSPSDANPFLKQNFDYAVVANNGSVVDPSRLKGFQVSVMRAPVKAASNDNEFPEYGVFETLDDVTEGIMGGLGLGRPWDALKGIFP